MNSRPAILPVSAVLPTLNCKTFIPLHLTSMLQWAQRVEEIIVVDSYSDDGTLELLKQQLTLPNVRFHSRPRGLYAAWNFGIGHIHSKYTYVSTIGDHITPSGLEHLVDVAEQFQADVVVSTPRTVDPSGREVGDIRWPVKDLIDWLAISSPTAIPSVQAFLMSAMPMREGILGSSASNLYRTDLLKRCPFPTQCGHAGDTAWSLMYALQTRFAITPSVISDFLIHPKNLSIDDQERIRLFEMFFDIGLDACRKSDPGGLLPLLETLRGETAELRARQRAYDYWRKHRFPWVLNPRAWNLRSRRNRQRQVVSGRKLEIRAKFGLLPKDASS